MGKRPSPFEVCLQKDCPVLQNCRALSIDYIVLLTVFIRDPLFGLEHELYLITMCSYPALP